MTVRDAGISVVLCTCNGAIYLPGQLESIAAQDLRPLELVVVDDHSGDATMQVLHDFAGKAPFPVRIHANETRLGTCLNFSRALSLARGDVIALCDQDDVWLPGRLAILQAHLQRLRTNFPGQPAFVFGDALVVDAALQSRGITHRQQQGLGIADARLPDVIPVQSMALGCACLFSADLLDLALPIPAAAVMHDWWLMLLASLVGQVQSCPEVTLLYRQHGHNVFGSSSRAGDVYRRLHAPWAAIVHAVHRYAQGHAQFCAAVQRLHERGRAVAPEAGRYAALTGRPGWQHVRCLRHLPYRRPDRIRNATLFLGALLYRVPRTAQAGAA